MNIYSIALFLHIVGALVLFAMLGLEWVGLRGNRNAANSDQGQIWLGVINGASKVSLPSMFTTVITGFYMMATVWRWTPWLAVTIGALILMIALARVAAPRLKMLGQSLITGNDLLLWISLQTRVAIVLGILFLKITKPNVVGSLFALGIAIVLGIASALPAARRERAQEGSAS